jgi:flagellar M-ring protein FliF
VEQARVHVTFPKDSVFLESREPAKASVLVKLRLGAQLSPRNVIAITHLVSSAVEGLSPDAVSVLDMQGNLLSRPVRSRDEEASDAALEYRQKVEHDLLQKISATLDPLLGHERYRAGVSADCDITSGEQSEETLDPARSVMVSSQKSEEVSAGSAAGGVPGTPSNLPRPVSRPGSSGLSTTRRTENVNYESSRIVRKVKMPQGTIKRVSVAVLLDQVRWEGTGKSARRVVTPPTPELMKSVHDVVAAVVGFQQTRGDEITVETLPFETTMNPPPVADMPDAPPVNRNDWRNQPLLIPIAIGAGVVLLLAVGMLLLSRRKKRADGSGGGVEIPQSLPGKPGVAAIQGSSAAEQLEAQLAERAAEQEQADLAALASIKVPPVTTKKTEVLAKQLRENVKKDPSSSAQILQSWIHDRG